MANDQSTALVRVEKNQQLATREPFEPENLAQARTLADDIAKSGLVPRHLQGNPYNVYVTLMWGRELGLSPMASVMGIWVEPKSGRPALYEQTALAIVKRSPLCKYFRLLKTSTEVATFETWRVGDPEPIPMSFTIEEARTAGLLHKDNWKSYPAAMLRSRCAMMLARAVYEDVLANVYTPDEVDGIIDVREAHPVLVAPPEPPKPAPAKKPAPAARRNGSGPAAEAAPATVRELGATVAQKVADAKRDAEDEAAIEALGKGGAPSQQAAAAAEDDADLEPPTPVELAIVEMYNVGHRWKVIGAREALAELSAIAAKVAAEVKAGTIDKEGRARCLAEHALVKRVINEGLSLVEEMDKRDAAEGAAS